MKASLIDRSNYYKGLLILIGRDRIIDEREHALMLQLGEMMDFDQRFCEAAIKDLLENKHLVDEPILFDEPKIAECFLRDALRLASIDQEIHSREMSWLDAIARTNNLPDGWLENEHKQLRESKHTRTQPDRFEIQQFI